MDIERRASEIEAVNFRADQLNDIYADGEISRNEVENLTKRFRVIQTRFYQIKKPEDKC